MLSDPVTAGLLKHSFIRCLPSDSRTKRGAGQEAGAEDESQQSVKEEADGDFSSFLSINHLFLVCAHPPPSSSD